jgi:DNA (cytosine-5)-methyltransferase 1
MIKKERKPVFIDLFAGAGGLSVGLEQAGFKLVAATDWDHWSCETLKANHGDIIVHEGDISKINLSDFAKKIRTETVDLIAGGPPCQGFSQLGKRMKDDPRNQLWREYMRFVAFFKPKIFLMENVPQLLTSEEFIKIKRMAENLGYEVKESVLHAVEYGVPQKRKRTIIIGSRIGTPKHPRPTHVAPHQYNLFNSELKPWKTVKDAISDLPLKPNGKNWHIGRNPTPTSLKRYKTIPPGGNRFNLPKELMPECWKRKRTGSTDVFGRLEWNKPSLTIRTEFFKPEKGRYLHPEAHRPITIREAARLQTFPDDYVFIGSNVQVAKQIGNAVPCRLGFAIGKELFQLLNPESKRLQNKVVYGLSSLQGQAA